MNIPTIKVAEKIGYEKVANLVRGRRSSIACHGHAFTGAGLL